MAGYITTIGQLLEKYYGGDVAKADAPVVTTTTGVYNAVYGAMAFSQLNNEANAISLLPKMPWNHSGWRVITADAGSNADGGTAENGAVAESIKPVFAEISTKPKQIQHVFENSFIQDGLVKKGDDNIGDMEFLRGYFAIKHTKAMNQQILVDVQTAASNNLESIDRITSSSAYDTAVGSAGDSDIYGIDRSASSWSDATVSHNSGTDRYLTDDILRDTIATQRKKGGRPSVLLTGEDTASRITGLYGNQIRYPGVLETNVRVQVGLNGVNTKEGMNAGIEVASVYKIPIFTSQNVAVDTISRIYLLDTTVNDETGVPRLFLALLYPTMYFESGMSANNPDPFAIGTLGTKGMYYTSGEVICTFLAAQASIRDLK